MNAKLSSGSVGVAKIACTEQRDTIYGPAFSVDIELVTTNRPEHPDGQIYLRNHGLRGATIYLSAVKGFAHATDSAKEGAA